MIQKAANTCPTPGSVTVFPLYSPDLVLQQLSPSYLSRRASG